MQAANEQSLGFWCASIGQQYFTLLHERLQHLGLERGYFALALIVESEGRVCQQELADALHMDKVAMARCIDHLCERGFVERAACPGDRRKYHLNIKPKAIPAARDIRKAYTALNQLALKGLPGKDRASMLHLLKGAAGKLHHTAPEPRKKRQT